MPRGDDSTHDEQPKYRQQDNRSVRQTNRPRHNSSNQVPRNDHPYFGHQNSDRAEPGPSLPSFTTSPEGFGTKQSWDYNFENEKHASQEEQFPPLGDKADTMHRELKKKVKEKILQRTKVTYDNFNVNTETVLDDGTTISFHPCTSDQQYTFAEIRKTAFSGYDCSVSAILMTNMDEKDKRSIVKELSKDCTKKNEARHEVVNEQSLPILQKLHIIPLEKIPAAFPDSLYYCELCDYHLNSVPHIKAHLEEQAHFKMQEVINEREKLVNGMPRLLLNQCKAIDILLEKTLLKATAQTDEGCNSMLDIANEIRNKIFSRLINIEGINENSCEIELIGSYSYGAELSDSDINFYLNILDLPSEKLYNVITTIVSNFSSKDNPFDNFDSVQMDKGSHPRISFKYEIGPSVSNRSCFGHYKKVQVTIIWAANEKLKLCRLLHLYVSHNCKLAKLMKLIRLWAKLCKLTPPNGLNKHGFDLMLIHCLQQRKKVPVILPSSTDVPQEAPIDFNLAEEFVAFFEYYTKKFDAVVQIETLELMRKRDTRWNNKHFQIKDPFRDDNVASFSKTFQPYFLNCFVSTFVYFCIPRGKSGAPIIEIELFASNVEEIESRKQKKNELRCQKTNPAEVYKNVDNLPLLLTKTIDTPGEKMRNAFHLDYRLKEHEERWQREGKAENEEGEEFIIRNIDKALSEESKKRKRRRNKSSTQQNGEQLAEIEIKSDFEPLTNADFPELVVNGLSIDALDSNSVEIDDFRNRQYSRRLFYDIRESVSKSYCEKFIDQIKLTIPNFAAIEYEHSSSSECFTAEEPAVNFSEKEVTETLSGIREDMESLQLTETQKQENKRQDVDKWRDVEIDDFRNRQYSRRLFYDIRESVSKSYCEKFIDQIKPTFSNFAAIEYEHSSSSECFTAEEPAVNFSEKEITETLSGIREDMESLQLTETQKQENKRQDIDYLNLSAEDDALELLLKAQAMVKASSEEMNLPKQSKTLSSGDCIGKAATLFLPNKHDHKDTDVDEKLNEGHEAADFLETTDYVPPHITILQSEEEANKSLNKTARVRFSQEDFRIRSKVWPCDEEFSQASQWSPDDYGYSFDESAVEYFTNAYLPDLRCNHCDSNKHASPDCPEMRLPDIVEIDYVREKQEWDFLDTVIQTSYVSNRLHIDDFNKAMRELYNMENCLQSIFPRSRLQLFGSMKNGFGTRQSDVDICFRFENDTPPEGTNTVTVLNAIASQLKNCFHQINVQVILNAKVPIVKFTLYKPVHLEGDISYYNTLALTNTQMLCHYTEWDQKRVPQLGIWVKQWAKACDIGDASHGSLSSYSYIIMLIHFLQNCDPPVLPRLQEQFRKDEPPVLHGEWDIYYHTQVTSSWSSNQQSAAQLFVGFLDYYSRFDFVNMVIQIRRTQPLTKLEKGWDRPICLEDPFDLNHNLGSGVKSRMYVHIVRTFRKSREIFMKEIKIKKSTVKDAYELLKLCPPGKAPQTRLCHYCSRVGHFREACPRRLESERFNSAKKGEKRWEARQSRERGGDNKDPGGGYKEYRRGNKEYEGAKKKPDDNKMHESNHGNDRRVYFNRRARRSVRQEQQGGTR